MGPASGGGGFDHADGSSGPPPILSQTHSVFQPGMGPQDIGAAYRPYHESGRQITYMDRLAEQKQVEEVFQFPPGHQAQLKHLILSFIVLKCAFL